VEGTATPSPAALTDMLDARTATREVPKLLFNASFANHRTGLEDSHQPRQAVVDGLAMGLQEFFSQAVEPFVGLTLI
jgi:hypothetical protein